MFVTSAENGEAAPYYECAECTDKEQYWGWCEGCQAYAGGWNMFEKEKEREDKDEWTWKPCGCCGGEVRAHREEMVIEV